MIKVCDMRKGYQKRLFPLSIFFALVFSVAAQAEKELDFELKREVLTSRLKNILIANDVNAIKRNLIDHRFSVLHAMPTYRELLLWRSKAPENEPFWNDITDLVREGMVAIIRDSQMGIPLKEWKGEGWPVSVIYINSYPIYDEVPDFNDLSTLKWMDKLSVKEVTPGSIGLSLTAKALMITVDRSPKGKKHAPLMLASALQELEILTQQLFLKKRWVVESANAQAAGSVKKIKANESERGVKMQLASMPDELKTSSEKKVLKEALGSVGKETYMPEQLVLPVDSMGWQVKHAASILSSQASLLEGLTYLYELLANDKLMNDFIVNGKIEGKRQEDWRKLVRRTIDVVFTVITTTNFDTVAGSFATAYLPEKGTNNRIFINDANRAINVLSKLITVFPNDAGLQKSVHKYTLMQAEFIKNAQGNKTIIPRGYMLKNGAHITGLMREFSSMTSYISIMLAAENIEADGSYKRLAKQQLDVAQKIFWAEETKVYRLSAGLKVSTYTGASFAMVLEWLRKLDAMMKNSVDVKAYVKNHIEAILKKASLLQSEGPATGEVHQPEYYLENEMDAIYTRIKNAGIEKLTVSVEEFLNQVSDQDGDGIFGVRFAGNKTGGAPVIMMQVGVATPLISGLGSDRKNDVWRNYGF